MIHVVHCSISFEYCPYHPSTSILYFFLLLLIRNYFLLNSQIHDINTRHNNNLHLPLTGLTLVQKGVAYSGCKIYNHLPPQTKNISNNVAMFKSKLKKFLLRYVFTVLMNTIRKITMIMVGNKIKNKKIYQI